MSWFEPSFMYQVYPLGLCGAPYENDGVVVHRLRKLIDDGWIDHMKKLGVTCLILNPVFESTSHGYDTSDYTKVDCRLGENQDLADAVAACHEQGIKVLLDGVFNHVGRDFWAFKDVQEKRWDSVYAGWFEIDWNGNNEWNDGFSYSTWQGVPYLIKLNHNCFDLNNYLADVIRDWERDFDIDGLRLDVAYCLDRGFLGYLRRIANELSEKRGDKFLLLGETMFGDYNQWMGDELCDTVTNYECYKGLWSSMNSSNMHEVAYALERQSGSHPWDLYTGKHLLDFVDNHDVPRIATQLDDKKQLKPLYGLLFGMAGVPCVYYGSEWGIKGEQKFGDHELRPALDAPEWNDLTDWIAQLAQARAKSKAIVWGSYEQLQVAPQQLVFKRAFEDERVIVAVNASSEKATVHFDAQCGRGTDLISGVEHDFGGGSELEPCSVCYWICE
ncbi:alpha-amylase family glycosyl hydrolase [Paratractidigestivibacter sp.]|uniref:alpha-amylase family glycosyl hydrolase n=1 Tax=Paratractidigestivibacter sp. TaxID=2847316 RepID=UPI002AC9D8A0|nr:alpha-amylase family glycosyl hydrolase [Paratractidigestivibacter sp.]